MNQQRLTRLRRCRVQYSSTVIIGANGMIGAIARLSVVEESEIEGDHVIMELPDFEDARDRNLMRRSVTLGSVTFSKRNTNR